MLASSRNIVFESSNIETVQSLVAAGMGLLSSHNDDTNQRQAEFTPAYLPFSTQPYRDTSHRQPQRRYLSKAAEAFIANDLNRR